MKIYTRTGDTGETSLYGGKRVLKSSPRVQTVGNVDELNSVIGLAIAQIQSSKFKVQSDSLKVKSELEKIQNDLFDVGAMLANPKSKGTNNRYLEQRATEFEQVIDTLTKELPELRNFILPGGSLAGAQLHVCRTVARRAERRIVQLSQKEDIAKEVLIYFNRLSDLLFTMARFVNMKEKKHETQWIKKT